MIFALGEFGKRPLLIFRKRGKFRQFRLETDPGLPVIGLQVGNERILDLLYHGIGQFPVQSRKLVLRQNKIVVVQYVAALVELYVHVFVVAFEGNGEQREGRADIEILARHAPDNVGIAHV